MGANVAFTADDVPRLAALAGVSLTADVSCDDAARALGGALNRYTLNVRLGEQRRERLGAAEWGQAVARWAREGKKLFGADTEDVSAQRKASLSAGVALMSGLRGADDPTEDEAINLAFEAGVFKTSQELAEARGGFWYNSVVERLQPTLVLLERLGERARDDKTTGRPAEYEKRELFGRLEAIYERIHAPARFRVSNPRVPGSHSSQRSRAPQGAALAWCRAVFALAPDRIKGFVGPDEMPEIKRLAKWAERPDAVAEYIRARRAAGGQGRKRSGKGRQIRGTMPGTNRAES